MAFTSTSANMQRGPIQRDEMQATDVASILREVGLPTVQHLMSGSLEPLRTAIAEVSPQRDSRRWMALSTDPGHRASPACAATLASRAH